MKIGLVSDVFYPYLKGGAEIRYYEIFTRLSNKNIINVFSMKWYDSKDFEIHKNIRINRNLKIDDFYDKEGKRKITPSISFSLKLINKINIIGENDIIESNSFPYFPCFSSKLASFSKKKPLIITFHEVWDKYWFSYLKNPIFSNMGKLIEKISTKLPTHMISVSKATKKLMVEKLNVNPSKITVIPNGVSLEDFEKIENEKNENKILFVGRLTPNKKIDVLIKAISLVKKSHPNIRLDIVGTGPLLNNLKKLTLSLGLENIVKFHGFIKETSDLIRFYKSSSIFVLPSIKEGFGIVLLEAMAAKTSIIAVKHKNSGTTDLIEHNKNGLLIKPNSPSDLAKNIIKLLEDTKLQSKFTKLGYIKAEKYSWNNISKKVERLYEKFI